MERVRRAVGSISSLLGPYFSWDISEEQPIPSQADNLDKLVEAGKKAAENGQFDLAETSALQVMVGAKEAMGNFLQHEKSPYRRQQIADWFGTCAFILNTTGKHMNAARCFYTATIFDDNWTIQEHVRVGSVLWGNILGGKLDTFRKNFQMLLTFLYELNEIAGLAESLKRWEICIQMSCEVLGTVELYIRMNRLDSRSRSKKVFRDFLMRVARCELMLGHHKMVKQYCHRVLDEFSDYDDPEAFEIWGKSLISVGDYTTAQKKMKLALEYAKNETAAERLHQSLEEISEHLRKPTETDEADPDWLIGTEAEKHKKVVSERETAPSDTSKKKRKHRRPKARDRSVPIYLDHTASSRRRRAVDEPTSICNRQEMVTNSGDIHSEQDVSANNAGTSTALPRQNQTKRRHASGETGIKLECDPCEVTSIASSSYIDFSCESDSSETSLSRSSSMFDVLSGLSEENLDETQEDDISFYELSCRFHGDSGDEEDIETPKDNKLLKEGLQLNASFLCKIKRENKSRKNVDHEFYDTLLTTSDCEEKLKRQPKRFKRCSLQIEGSHKSYCTSLSSDNKISVIEISGRSKAGRTFNEDEVAVEILDDVHEDKDKRYGKVVGILKRERHRNVKHPVFVCTLDDMESYLVRPMCKTVPKINILHNEIYKRCYNQRKNKIEVYKYDHRNGALELEDIKDINRADRNKYVFLVAFLQWEEEQNSIYPLGAVIRVLPCGDSLLHGLKILDLQHEVPSVYSAATVRRLESVSRRHTDEPPDKLMYNRLDLTEIDTFTIDPSGSKDLDDALSIEKLGDCFRVGVHIADVSVYVENGDAIDKEAYERAITFYPGVKRPRHMLPEPLSQNICSLVPNKKKLCISVLHYLDSEGQRKNTEIKLTVIKSRQQFTYREVQEIIQSPKSEEGIPADIRQLYHLAEKRRKRRLGNAMFALDLDTDDSSEDWAEDTLEAHYLVEEYMVLTNWKIAMFVATAFPNLVPQRCQAPPTRESLNSFMKEESTILHLVLKLQDKKIYPTPSLDTALESKADQDVMVQKWLWDLILQSPEKAARFIKMDELQPLQCLAYQHWLSIQEHAYYKCSGSLQKQEGEGNHFSLGYAKYTHFTSPIRRYIDLIVHRLVHCKLQKQTAPYSTEDVERICLHVNSMTKKSKAYQKGCKILQKSIHLKSDPRMYLCFINEVSDKGVSLCASELRLVSKEFRELPFNLLDMGFKPEEVQDAKTGEVRIKAKWRKRLYDVLQSPALPDSASRETLLLLQHPGIIYVRAWDWAKILKCVLEGRYKDCKTAASRAKALLPDKGLEDVNTESRDPTKLQPNTTFCLSFSRGQSVKIQMTAAASKGILAPRPQLYIVSKSFKCCLQHTDDPVLYLATYSKKSTLDKYQSVGQYLERWLPLVIMEAAVGSVSSEDTCTINNVPIKFKRRSGKFSLPLSFCELRNIEFGGTIDEGDKDSDVNKKSCDFLCIKYRITKETVSTRENICPPTECFWIAHGEIIKVFRKKETTTGQNFTGDGKIIVNFDLHPLAADPPMEEADGNGCLRCGVEILVKSEVDRRTETYLKMLPEAKASLAARIALNDKPFSDLDKDHSNIADLMERDLYIPPNDDFRPLPRNNIRQQEAIDKALGSRFSLIQGPPGTGKTYTGIKLLYLFNKINRTWSKEGNEMKQVLFCGPSNKSVDLVARWMLQRLRKLCPKIVRMYGRSIEAGDFPIPGKSFLSKRSTHNAKADEELREVSLHHLIRKKGNSFAETINAFDAKFRKTNYEPAPNDVKKYLKILRDASIDELKKYEVILCTTAVGANPKVLEGTNIFQVIIDESGMCPEPQCLVPIIATKAEQVVLIGDHKQLRPIIMCKEAAELGLETSLFEKYWLSKSAQRVETTMLDTQYRMNPQLCRLPSELFYHGKLRTESGLWKNGRVLDIWTNKDRIFYPHVLIHVEGEEEVLTVSTEDGNEQSKSNEKEIEQVIKMFHYLIDEENIPANQVNVISQYNAQCSEIRRRLEAEGVVNYKVNTVVSSQGGEWDYVIFSTVRSLPEYKIEKWPTLGWCKQNLGFITDQNQINVALTRARKGLIIIGNTHLLRCDEVWRKLVEHYEEKGCIKSPEEFPPKRTRQERMRIAQEMTRLRYGDQMYIPGEKRELEPYQPPADERNDRRFSRQRFQRSHAQQENNGQQESADGWEQPRSRKWRR